MKCSLVASCEFCCQLDAIALCQRVVSRESDETRQGEKVLRDEARGLEICYVSLVVFDEFCSKWINN